MTSWVDDVAQQMFMTIWKNKDNWPAPTACTDAELQAWWDESMDTYNMYWRIITREEKRRDTGSAVYDCAAECADKDEWNWSTTTDNTNMVVSESLCFTDDEMARLYTRVEEIEAELDAIDYEWRRRPWLNKKAENN
jgi:hypothetical protein